MDTIFALATAPGRAGLSVIRISGPLAHKLQKLGLKTLPPVRTARVGTLKDGTDVVDHPIIVRFDAPKSFTGEDVVELQCHGSPAIVARVSDILANKLGFRLADPGEFTRRALDNGRLGLSQVEGLSDLIEAETEAQRRQAQKIFAGAFGQLVDGWRSELVQAGALIAATLDFSEEEVPETVTVDVRNHIQNVISGLARQIAGQHMSERIRTGFEVAIVGETNVGKSTLVNYLAGREAAITSEIAGTTRDVIEVRMDLKGLAVTVLDTAGQRETDDKVENMGIRRARERAEQADLRVFLTMNTERPKGFQKDDIVVRPKADLMQTEKPAISGKTGHGVSALIEEIAGTLKTRARTAGLATRVRHVTAMQSALDALQNALIELSKGPDNTEFVSEELRRGCQALECLVGRVDVEDLLEEIFARFCIGK
ncbi:MAG: tRNA uridine-5-carboxymethylaminomethyl(34) synthesis GTPase MnmE [Aestuariivita sp.]|nr:tRNA uridine-5-carboxymethylaminomethyl(34) synthesis GTPase MnmE [Aestuariivita sp.]